MLGTDRSGGEKSDCKRDHFFTTYFLNRTFVAIDGPVECIEGHVSDIGCGRSEEFGQYGDKSYVVHLAVIIVTLRYLLECFEDAGLRMRGCSR